MQHTTPIVLSYSKKVYFALGALAVAVVAAFALALAAFAPTAQAVTAAEKQAEAEEALANLNAMQETLDRLSAEYGEAQMAQEKAEKKRDAAEKRIGEITTELEGLQVSLSERARDMYRQGGVPFLDMVLGASTFEEFATSLDMVSKVNQSNADMIDRERSLKQEAEEQAQVLEEQANIAAQKAVEAEQAAEQAQATVAELDAIYENLSAEAAQLLEEERKAKEEEERARAAAVLAAAQAAAEEEERQRAAQAAAEAQKKQDEEESSGEEENSSASSEESENGENEKKEEKEEQSETQSEPAYEGGTDTVSRARACMGAPYVWGGVGPEGYDCSGLVSYCLTGSHSRLGTTYTFMEWPSVSDPQPGDIAVNWSHTGVYIGGGQMIHASTYGVGVIEGPVQDGMKIVRYPG